MSDLVKSVWEEAAHDLQIRLGNPNGLSDVPSDSDRVVFLPDFGGPKGTIVFVQDFESYPLRKFNTTALVAAGYFFSTLSHAAYSKYSRNLFVETLLDWGYFGNPSDCPVWYADAIRKLECSREGGGTSL